MSLKLGHSTTDVSGALSAFGPPGLICEDACMCYSGIQFILCFAQSLIRGCSVRITGCAAVAGLKPQPASALCPLSCEQSLGLREARAVVFKVGCLEPWGETPRTWYVPNNYCMMLQSHAWRFVRTKLSSQSC